MMKKLLILLVCFAMIISCSAKKASKNQGKPKWVDNPKSAYPESVYLSALGSGSGFKEAQSSAMGNLARIFEANVKSSSVYNERYQELTKNNKTTAESNSELNKSTSISADQKLMNMEVGPSWTDKQGQVYTIAYINRQKTADIYTQKIEENDQRVVYYLDQRSKANDTKVIYACYSAASVFADANRVLLDQLAIISQDELDMLKLNYNEQQLKKNLAESAANIHFNVKIENDDKDKITSQFTSLLSEMGFGLNPANAIQIKGKTLIEDVDLQSAQKFVRYTFDINVIDTNGISLFTMSDTGREGHLNIQEARARALRTISGKIQNEFKKRLVAYFDGLVQKK
jgi:hypothetical protein